MLLAPGLTFNQHASHFNSEGHSASALLPGLHHVLPGSLEIALKRTRPRQRFCYVIRRYSMRERGIRQEGGLMQIPWASGLTS